LGPCTRATWATASWDPPAHVSSLSVRACTCVRGGSLPVGPERQLISYITKPVRNEARYVVHVGANFSGRRIPNQTSYSLLDSCKIPAHYASGCFGRHSPSRQLALTTRRASPRRRRLLRRLFLFTPSATGLFRPRSLRHCNRAGFYPVRHHYAFQLLVAFLVLGFVSSAC
jgi:hypothetical protein